MKSLDNFFKKLPLFLQECKRNMEKYIWPNFDVSYTPEDIRREIAMFPIHIQKQFQKEYYRITRGAKNTRNISMVVFVISLLGAGPFGSLPIILCVIAYWWYTKEYKIPNYARKAFSSVVDYYQIDKRGTGFFTQFERKPFHSVDKPRKLAISYDPFNLTLENLNTGFLVDYSTITWQVTAHYQYDWNDDTTELFSKLINDVDSRFLFLKKEEQMKTIYIGKTVNIYIIIKDFDKQINSYNKLHFEGNDFFKENQMQGYVFDMSKRDLKGFYINCWEYYDVQRKNIIRIEKRHQGIFKAYICEITSEFEFSDILPCKKKS